MADNIIQRSHRQDDSRFGNDDPLMELSRIMGTPDEGNGAASHDAFALDLERELMGGFEEQPASQSAGTNSAHDQQAEDDRLAVEDFQQAIERELASDQAYGHDEQVGNQAAAYAEPDYADYEPHASYEDSEAGEGAPTAHAQRTVVEAPTLSLEDELENLLSGAAQPVAAQRTTNASWGYGSQAHIAGRPDPAPSITRTMAYQQPVAQPAPEPAVQPAPEAAPVSYEATDEDLQQAEDDFDSDELMAAFDDFDVSAESEEEDVAASHPVFPLYQAVEEAAPAREPLDVPVALPVASAPKVPEVHDLHDYEDELDRAASAIHAAPDVDTISVTENRVDFTEALDLPEVHYEDDVPAQDALGELESEFAEVFGSIEADEVRASQAPADEPAKAEEEDKYADIFADVFGNKAEQGQYSAAGYAAAAAGVAAMGAAAASARQGKPLALAHEYGPEDDVDFGYDPRRDNVDIAATPYGQKQSKRRSSLFVPGVAAAVVLVVVAGAAAYKWVGSSGGDPVVIMADKTPIKVQPETTSTAVVPNQDKAVYDKDATAAPAAPKQDQLVTTREDPVDLAADEDEEDPIADKAEERVDPAQQDTAANDQPPAEGHNSLAPRKVQTMVVKPDGTMVASIPQDDQALSTGPAAAPADRPAAATAAPATGNAPAAPQVADTSGDDDAIGALVQDNAPPAAPAPAPQVEAAKPAANTPAAKVPAAAKLPAKPVEAKKITQETVASVTPKNAPVVDRPADQPVDIVDRVPPKNAAGQQVASAAPAAGSYLIQIASQPNVEGAQKTYASLSQKFASVIGGRGVDIKQAEIAGKGTFFRVRIPAGSKSDAINLCTKYKAAGGSCFVTQ